MTLKTGVISEASVWLLSLIQGLHVRRTIYGSPLQALRSYTRYCYVMVSYCTKDQGGPEDMQTIIP